MRTSIMCISITKFPEIIIFLFLVGIFSLDFKREFRRCCCCLQAKARQEEVATRILRQHSVHQNTTSSAICKPAKNHRGKKDYEHICMKERDNVSSGREESFISKNYLWRPRTLIYEYTDIYKSLSWVKSLYVLLLLLNESVVVIYNRSHLHCNSFILEYIIHYYIYGCEIY